METIQNLITRFRSLGVLIIIGFILIIYVALGFLYVQQGTKQTDLDEKIASLTLVLSKQLPSAEKLRADYDVVNSALAPMTDSAAIAMLVGIAEESGIDVDPDSGKLHVPAVAGRDEKVGGGNYLVLSFRNISVQGDYVDVMAFISDLDSGTTLETMVLKNVDIRQVETQYEYEGEEGIEIGTRSETLATLEVDIYTKPQEGD